MKMLESLERKIRAQGKSRETYKTYAKWCKDYFIWLRDQNGGAWKHPDKACKDDIEQWLTHLSNDKRVSANTQNVAMQAVLYLYRYVLGISIEGLAATRARRKENVREVLDQSEIQAVIDHLRGVPRLIVLLMYATGVRIGDLLHVRVKDISFERKQIFIRGAKGDKDRVVGFPIELHELVRAQINQVSILWKHDQEDNLNGVSLPDALGRKMPNARKKMAWYYLFPSDNYSMCPYEKRLYRHHRDRSHINRCIGIAVEKAKIHKRITSHCLRHSFSTHSLESGVDIKSLQTLLGHADIRTTETYLHVKKDGVTAARSPIKDIEVNATDKGSTAERALQDALRKPQKRETLPEGSWIPRIVDGTGRSYRAG